MRTLLRLLGCLALALLLTSASAADEKKDDKKDKKEEKKDKKDEKKPQKGMQIPDAMEQLLDGLGGGGLDDEAMQEIRQQIARMRKVIDQIQKGGGVPKLPPLGAMPKLPQLGGGGMVPPVARRASLQETRLGVKLSEPSAALIDQLDLPRDQGLVLEEVGANSAAAKAGLKSNDILLEVNGTTVSRKKEEFDKVLAAVEADKAVEVVVMRKGKKETLKGLKLP